jgi:hypothetical protein
MSCEAEGITQERKLACPVRRAVNPRYGTGNDVRARKAGWGVKPHRNAERGQFHHDRLPLLGVVPAPQEINILSIKSQQRAFVWRPLAVDTSRFRCKRWAPAQYLKVSSPRHLRSLGQDTDGQRVILASQTCSKLR